MFLSMEVKLLMPLVRHCIDLEKEMISLRTMKGCEHTFTHQEDMEKVLAMKIQNTASRYMEKDKNGTVTVVNNTPRPFIIGYLQSILLLFGSIGIKILQVLKTS